MFGSELALGEAGPRARACYRILGHDLIGLRVRALHFKKMLDQIPVPRTILDAGSGDGCYSFYLARRFPQAQVVGVELDGDLVANCKLILSKLELPNLEFIQADLVTYTPQNRFDLICNIDVLEHLVEDELVLRKMRSALQRSGTVLVHVPQQHQLNRLHFRRPCEPGLTRQTDHVRDEYTEAEITHKMVVAGFKIEDRRYTFGQFGSPARELGFAMQSLGTLRPVAKGFAFPLLMSLAYLDTLTLNKGSHQGFFFKASPDGSPVDQRDTL